MDRCVPKAATGLRTTFFVHRFTREEHERGDTTGWRFEVGWCRRMSGLEWAWFSREINNGKKQIDP